MTRDRIVTFETRIPLVAAFELDRDDIEIAVVMGASSLGIDVDSVYLMPVNFSNHPSTIPNRLGTKHGPELI